tara:strand:+ start:774 stop:1352 length:579 start_codon:yes stop_codon:yes gene_type:complete
MNPEEEMMPPEAPVGAEGEASPDQVMEAQDEQMAAQAQAIMDSAPMPESPFTYKLIEKLHSTMGEFIKAVTGEDTLPEFVIPEGETKLDDKLPAEVLIPYVATMGFLSQIEEAQKHIVLPEDVVSDAQLRKAAANFGVLKKNKKLIAKIEEMTEPAQEEAPEAPEDMPEDEVQGAQSPGAATQQEEEMMEMM